MILEFFGKKRPKKIRPPEGAWARLLRWGVLVFLGYAIWQGLASPVTNPAAHPASDCPPPVSHSISQDFPALTLPLLPTSIPQLRSEDTRVGAGDAAQCGAQVTFRYSLETPRKQAVFSNLNASDAASVAQLGTRQVLRGVELALIGMRSGGERTVIIPPPLGFDGGQAEAPLPEQRRFQATAAMRKDPLFAHIRLEHVTHALPLSAVPLRVIDQGYGRGMALQCGDTARVRLTLWKLDGTPLFQGDTAETAPPLAIRIGGDLWPVGLEQGLIGLQESRERVILLPPAYNAPLMPGPSAMLPSLPAEMILALVRLMPEAESPPPSR